MKKIIFSIALLNISLIFSAPAKPEAKTKSSKKPRILSPEEHKNASIEGFKNDYALIDAVIKNHKEKIGLININDEPNYKLVTDHDSKCKKEIIDHNHVCAFPISDILSKYFLKVDSELYNTWKKAVCEPNSNISPDNSLSINHHRNYGDCQKQ